MPIHYTNIIIVSQGSHEENRGSWLARLAAFAKDPFEAAIPSSREAKDSAQSHEAGIYPLWYREALQRWGTKWGGYDALPPIELTGDGGPVLLIFCSAWDSGHAEAHAAIEEYARHHLNCGSFAWVGFNPYDNSVQAIRNVVPW